MTEIVKRTAAIEGDVHQPYARRIAEGTDLDYVLFALDCADTIDVETEDASDTEWAVHKALNYVRDEIRIRRAVQAGPDAVGDYCGVADGRRRACGSELGLPDCRYHSTCPMCGLTVETGDLDWYRLHEGRVCRVQGSQAIAEAKEG